MQETDPRTCAAAPLSDEGTSASLFRGLVEQSKEGFLVLADDGVRAAYANPRLAEILGYRSAADILALPSCLELVAPGERDTLRAVLQGAVTGDRELRGLRPDGDTVWVECRVVRLPWCGDSAVCMIVGDISMRKQLDRQLAHLDRLRIVYEMEAELVHEVAQPLSALQGYATAIEQAFVRDTATPERVLALVGKIRRCGDNVRDTIRRMRNFGRRERTADAPADSADPAATVREAVEIAMRGIRSRNPDVRVAMSLPAGLPAIDVDPLELQQVVVNLLHNAANALPEDAPPGTRIVVRAERHGRRLVLEIADSGAGMSPETLSHIFEPFFTTKADGVGLGLKICRCLVEGWGGQLRASSRGLGQGTTMRFDLPFAVGLPAAGS